MRNNHERGCVFLDAAQGLAQAFRVERGEAFIEYYEVRLLKERASDEKAAFLSLRELPCEIGSLRAPWQKTRSNASRIVPSDFVG